MYVLRILSYRRDASAFNNKNRNLSLHEKTLMFIY